MAYCIGEKLYEFVQLYEAILDNDYLNMAIEIIDSKYFIQLKERSKKNVLIILNEIKDDPKAIDLINQINERLE